MSQRLIRSSLAYGSAEFLGRFLSFATFPIFARIFDVEEFGTLALVTTLAALAGLVSNPGLNNAVQRYYLEPRFNTDQRRELVTAGLAVLTVWASTITAAIVLVVYLVLPRTEVRHALPLAALLPALIACVPGQIVLFAQDLLRLHFRPWAFGVVSLLRNIAWFVFAMALILGADLRLDGYFLGQLLGVGLIVPGVLWLVRRDLTTHVNRGFARELIVYGYPFIFGGLAYWVLQSLDLWMLKTFSDEMNVGLYSVAGKIAVVVTFASLALGQAWAPYALKAHAEDPNYRRMVARFFTLWLFFLIVLGAGLSLFASDMLHLLTPASYWPAADAARILAFGAVLAATMQVSVLALSIERKTGLIAACSWLAVLVSAAANSVLIPRLGVLGASLANLATYLVLSGTSLFFSQRLHPLPLETGKLGVLLAVGAIVLLASLRLDRLVDGATGVGVKLAILAGILAFGMLARIVTWPMIRDALPASRAGA